MATQSLQNLLEPPPRLTGDAATDTVSVIQWLNAFYVKGVLSGALLQPQNLDPALISLAALPGVADTLAYFVGEDEFDLTGFTSFARTLLDDADAATARATLGAGDVNGPASSTDNHVAVFDGTTGKLLKDGGAPAGDVVGPAAAVDGNVALFDTTTGKLIKDGGTLGTAAFTAATAYDAAGAAAAAQAASQPVDSQLSSIAALVDAAGWLHNDGAGAFVYSTPSASDVGAQPADADLTTWAGVTPGTGVATALAVNVGTAGAVVVNGGALGTPSSGTLTNCTSLPAAGVTGTALVAAAIGSTVQAYDADLTTWAGITPGANVGTFLATPSSANLAAALTDETGSGKAVFDNAPSFTTGIGIGGTAAGAGGVAFPSSATAVADANTLDDYEEGTYDATVGPQTSGSITLDSSNNTLAYTKIGRVCHVQGRLTVSSVSSPVGYMRISLPFSSAALSESSDIVPCQVIQENTTNAQTYIAFITPSTQYIQVYAWSYTGSSTTNCANYVQAATIFYVSATYITA